MQAEVHHQTDDDTPRPPELNALSSPQARHAAQRVGQFLPGQPRQHPRVGAQGIAVEACGAGCLEPLEVAGFGFFYTAGQIQRPAAGAVRELQQGPAVVDQLEAIPQAGEGGMFKPGGLGSLQRRWGSGAVGGG